MKSVTKEHLEQLINKSEVSYTNPKGTLTHCIITMPHGFTVTGESACVDPSFYNKELGEKYALEKAVVKLWELEGYLLSVQLASVQHTEIFDFGTALSLLKLGDKVSRKGWNGADMFVYLVPAASYPIQRNNLGTLGGMFPEDLAPYREYLALKTAQNDIATWTPSCSDALAEDWYVVA